MCERHSICFCDCRPHICNRFDSIYCPWLNLQPGQGGNSPFLTLARCLVASRHLDSVTRSSVVPQLQRLTEEVSIKHMFNPTPSTQSIQAMLILSLWASVGGSPKGEVPKDGRLLIGGAVSMAMNLRLSQAVAYLADLRNDIKEGHHISDSITSDLEDAKEKARLVGRTVLLLISSQPITIIHSGFLS
jgi:hypothetical protein